MSKGLATALRSDEPPVSGSGLLLSLVAAAVFPFDRVLAGMVGAGLGIEAISLYLGLSRAALDDALVRLDLRTPHDRKLRKPGAHAWSVLDTMRLIAWRVAGIHPETIGNRLGRSANAVRAKARRLGIPAPPRRELRRADPSGLVDPTPGFGFLGTPSAAEQTRARFQSDVCGTATGPAVQPDVVVTLRPGLRAGGAAPIAPVRAKGFRRPTGQRELQLFRIVPGTEPALPPLPTPLPEAPNVPPPALPSDEPEPPAPRRSRGAAAAQRRAHANPELVWIATARDLPRNRELVEFLSLRYFGRQDYKKTAQEIGMTESAIATFYGRIDLPRDPDRSKFGETYDEALARANLAKSGYELVTCRKTRRWLWRHKSDRANVHYNRETRRAMGLVSEYEKHKSQRITL